MSERKSGRQEGPSRTERCEREAFAAADRLTREVVAVTEALSEGPGSPLGRLLREGAAAALAGVASACRETSRGRALRHLAVTRHGVRRLGTWIDLAERFGDVPLESALEILETQSRLLVGLDLLAAAWRAEGGRCPWHRRHRNGYTSIELTLPPC
ncbi:MAG TPA: hypothetical protein VHQ65_10120 [Thermoanaerobaculia bacterium]|nr:hypothetical protein [Thermoanaerobaculia bacterium]